MVKILHHGYLGKCEVCGKDLPLGPGKKGEHYKKQHPELKFSPVRSRHKTTYKCDLCDRVQAISNYAGMVSHYQDWHPEVIKEPVFLRTTNETEKKGEKGNPVQEVDRFFDSLSALMIEVEQLRREKKEWMQTAEKWANKIVELQELLGRKL